MGVFDNLIKLEKENQEKIRRYNSSIWEYERQKTTLENKVSDLKEAKEKVEGAEKVYEAFMSMGDSTYESGSNVVEKAIYTVNEAIKSCEPMSLNYDYAITEIDQKIKEIETTIFNTEKHIKYLKDCISTARNLIG